MPPYVIGHDQIDLLVDGTLATLQAVAAPSHEDQVEGGRDAALA
jgi:adenosylmethionine-8-amino-7-oxononanoate aminotransferase